MGIISSLFNKRFNIYRVTNPTPSTSMFEIDASQYVIVSTNIQGRLTRGILNEPQREGAFIEAGAASGYKDKLFVPAGTDIQVGDRIIESGVSTNRFYVDYVNDLPGGTSNHIECILTASDFDTAS